MAVRNRGAGRRPLRVAVALGACVAAPVGVTLAQPSEDRAVALEWIAPDECPVASYVEQEVGRLLGGAPFTQAARLRARAEVAHSGQSWRVRLVTVGDQGEGHRELTAETCRSAADATALILALAIDPRRVASFAQGSPASEPPDADSGPIATFPPLPLPDASTATPAAPAPATTPAPAPAPTPAPAPAPTPTPTPTPTPATPTPPPILIAGLDAVADLGTLPSAAPGIHATLAAALGSAPWLRLEIGAALWGAQSILAPSTASGYFELRTFDVLACALAPLARWALGACAGAEIAWISAHGISETDSTESSDVQWPVVLAQPTTSFLLGSGFSLRASVGVGFGINVPTFVAKGVPPFAEVVIHRPDVIAKRADLGLEVRF